MPESNAGFYAFATRDVSEAMPKINKIWMNASDHDWPPKPRHEHPFLRYPKERPKTVTEAEWILSIVSSMTPDQRRELAGLLKDADKSPHLWLPDGKGGFDPPANPMP